jgi:hypothetical protein
MEKKRARAIKINFRRITHHDLQSINSSFKQYIYGKSPEG